MKIRRSSHTVCSSASGPPNATITITISMSEERSSSARRSVFRTYPCQPLFVRREITTAAVNGRIRIVRPDLNRAPGAVARGICRRIVDDPSSPQVLNNPSVFRNFLVQRFDEAVQFRGDGRAVQMHKGAA